MRSFAKHLTTSVILFYIYGGSFNCMYDWLFPLKLKVLVKWMCWVEKFITMKKTITHSKLSKISKQILYIHTCSRRTAFSFFKLVRSEIPPWQTKILSPTTVAKGNQQNTLEHSSSICAASPCWKEKLVGKIDRNNFQGIIRFFLFRWF